MSKCKLSTTGIILNSECVASFNTLDIHLRCSHENLELLIFNFALNRKVNLLNEIAPGAASTIKTNPGTLRPETTPWFSHASDYQMILLLSELSACPWFVWTWNKLNEPNKILCSLVSFELLWSYKLTGWPFNWSWWKVKREPWIPSGPTNLSNCHVDFLPLGFDVCLNNFVST